ncbi:MAG TPA: YiiD C-terminal domain-containing protein [Longimicrobiales bacterium]|nr:YiiD C-terminal domain-containing protein [Longimicrobiales bacterium]
MNQDHLRADEALATLYADIPLARALGIEIVHRGPTRVELTAPFEPNRNGHGTLFGGSAVSIALIAGWLLVHGWVEAAGTDADVVIHQLDARFDVPIDGNARATADAPPTRARERFEKTLDRRGRARVDIPIRVGSVDTSTATELVGRYVALRHGS